MGSPFGNEDSIAVGVVSAIRRSIALADLVVQGRRRDPDRRADHARKLGGPLFDARGRVIGINAQIRSEHRRRRRASASRFRSTRRKRSMAQLVATGTVVYAYLGVTTEDLTPTLARHLGYAVSRGAMIGEVRAAARPTTPACAGGSDEADASTARTCDYGRRRDRRGRRASGCAGADEVVREVGSRLPGETIRLTVVRGQTRKTRDREARRATRHGDES